MDNAAAIVYSTITQTRLIFSSTAILIYPSLLHLIDEVEYIWKQKITLPAILYMLAKYPVLALQVLEIVQLTVPTESLRTCNILGTLYSVLAILPFIGVQGLIVARTYALYTGPKSIMAVALGILFLAGLAPNIYRSTLPAFVRAELTKGINSFKQALIARGYSASTILQSVSIILQDFIAFVVVVYHAWGVRKLKRSVGLRGNKDLATSLLQQGILRFCFISFVALASTILINLASASVASGFSAFQNVLSTILICDFTLELRKRNSKTNHQTSLSTPDLSFQEGGIQSVRQIAERLHESIVNELGENLHHDIINSDSPGDSAKDLRRGYFVDELYGSTSMTGEDAHIEIGCGEATSIAGVPSVAR